jgi:hypothetical protein
VPLSTNVNLIVLGAVALVAVVGTGVAITVFACLYRRRNRQRDAMLHLDEVMLPSPSQSADLEVI